MDPKKINCEFCSSVLDNPCRLLNCNHVVCNHHIELSLNNDFYKCPINDCLIQNYNFEKEPIEEIKLYKELNCLYHRNAWSLYCKNCNLVLCQSCILDHPPSHHIVGIGDQKFLEKAQKDKSKIDILLENSKDSLDSRTKLFEKKIEQYNELESTIDLYMEGLQTSFLNTIGLLRNHIKQDIKTKCLEATTKFNNLKKIQNSILGTSGTLSPKPTGIPDDLSKVRQYQDSLNSYQQLGQTTTIAEYHIHGYLSEFENVFKQINQNIIIPIENRRQDTVVLPISISNLQTTHQKDIYVERFNNNINPTILSKLDYKIDNPIQSFSTLHLQGSIGIGKTSALLNFGLYCLEKSLFKYIFYIRCGDFYLKDLKTILLNYFFVDEEELRDEACVKQQFKNINHESTLLLFDNTLYNVLLLNDLMFFEQNGIKMIIASRLDQNSKDLDTSKNKLVLEPFTIPESIQLMKSCLNRDFPNHQLEEISKLLHFNPQKIKEECLILNSKSGLSMNEYIDNLKYVLF
ncbi:hypothetical protein CYY_007188 [Polysphondylium violaceum]|uniref:B box-type domain-containing protein n=1 Tax=Polysphondylium violaceum TaxID=133409 RepID=A0A8J4PPK3_9MYCE|nr:hypothetical protein CYY_007188 [Polysphondylium violaceum]